MLEFLLIFQNNQTEQYRSGTEVQRIFHETLQCHNNIFIEDKTNILRKMKNKNLDLKLVESSTHFLNQFTNKIEKTIYFMQRKEKKTCLKAMQFC